MTMLHNGIPQNPFAVRRVDIYRGSIRPGNLVSSVPFVNPDDPSYPFPAITDTGDTGFFQLLFDAPEDLNANDIYFDVWRIIGTDPGTGADLDDENNWISQTGMFWLFDDVWLTDDGLLTKRLGFEPLDKKLRRGEIRTIELAIHPLPHYAYDFNLLAPIIPQLNPTITVWTSHDELISGLVDAPCSIGIRQGHNRNSPYVVQCTLDTRTLVRGAYRYSVKVNIGGEVLISPKFGLTVQ
jgi:hypothetical protein